MRYKIECFFHKTFYIYSKESLFNFIDYQIKINPFSVIFSDRFEKSFNDGFYVRDHKEVVNDYGYSYYTREYVKSLFIIKDEKGFAVDLNKLKNEYEQSREIKPYVFKRRLYDRSTRKYRKPIKTAKYSESANTYRKEYSLMMQDVKDGIKTRASRLGDLKCQLVRYYDDEVDYKKSTKSWKSKKIKKQWEKHLK